MSPSQAGAKALDARPTLGRRLGMAALILAAWAAVALALSLEGYLTSHNAGRPQPWWPSFGYSLAIFSVWAVLTWPLLAAVRAVERRGWPAPARLAAYAAGVVPVCALHVGLFAAVFWPIYNDGGRIASRLAMGEIMFVRNLGADAILYAALVAIGVLAGRRAARTPASAPTLDHLRARRRGSVRLVPLDHVEWIGAAGNYAEAQTADGPVLLDESLARLSERLPKDRFARIHRSAIVRLDRVVEVRSVGRGDAEVRLADGQVLRLSRRYRPALSAWLGGR